MRFSVREARLVEAATLFGLLAVVALTGCRLITGDEIRRERQLGVIRLGHQTVVVEIPNAVTRNTDLSVTVSTFGNSCVDKGDTEVTTSGSSAEIRPFDIFVTHAPRNYSCADILRTHVHGATLRFSQAGLATVRVRGRIEPGGETMVVERQVTVQ
jgi:hypothetical protein